MARRALENHSQLHGSESAQAAGDLGVLAEVLSCFNDVDDDEEIPRLYEQSIAMYARLQGSSCVNVGIHHSNFGGYYFKKATKALKEKNQKQCVINLELALPHLQEAARVHKSNKHMERADRNERMAIDTEKMLRLMTTQKTKGTSAAAAGAAKATRG